VDGIADGPEGGRQDSEDRVGYKRPPKNTRFKPGQSGNPKGRPKARTNFKTDFEAAIFRKVDVTIDGQKVRLNKQQLLFHQLINKALGGDLKATALVLKYLPEIAGKEADQSPAVSANLQKIAENYLLRQRGSTAPPAPATEPAAPNSESGDAATTPEEEHTDDRYP